MSLTLDQIDLLEDTWAEAACPTTSSTCCAPRRRCSGTSTRSTPGFWAVTRYDDVRAVSRDHVTFSAELGSTFLADMDEEAMELVRMTILNMDPPKHFRFRRLVSAGFTPRMINALVDHIQELATGIVDGLEGEDEIEFVEQVAAELPLLVICELLGVPVEDRHLVFDWSNRMVGAQDPDFRVSEEDGEAAMAEIYMYCDAPRRRPSGQPARRHHHGARPGRDRRRAAVGPGAQHVLRHPRRGRQRDHPEPDQPLDARPHRQPGARRSAEGSTTTSCGPVRPRRCSAGAPRSTTSAAPPPSTPRSPASRSRRATRSSSTTPPPTATRTVFDDPHRFDVGRTPNDHVTFGGGGVHFCLGASLARAEIKTMLRTFLAPLPERRAGRPAQAPALRLRQRHQDLPVRSTADRPNTIS